MTDLPGPGPELRRMTLEACGWIEKDIPIGPIPKTWVRPDGTYYPHAFVPVDTDPTTCFGPGGPWEALILKRLKPKLVSEKIDEHDVYFNITGSGVREVVTANTICVAICHALIRAKEGDENDG